MKVCFDHQIFTLQRYGGVTRYFVELLRAIRVRHDAVADVIAPAHINAYLRKSDSKNPYTFKMPHPERGLRYRPYLVAPIFKLGMARMRPDIVHVTHYLLASRHLGKTMRSVVTCHDMIAEKFPHLMSDAEICHKLKLSDFKRADAIVCVSENTRKDLLDIHPEFESKTHVVLHGVGLASRETLSRARKNFLLYVGVRTGYKNFENLLRAIGYNKHLRSEFELICFGGGAFSEQEIRCARSAGFPPEKMQQVQGDDTTLSRLYREAAAFVFPSLYEGFGMPLVEAMMYGCPVVCSNTSCFPEICGDVAQYFDPVNIESIGHAIELAVYNTSVSQSGRLLERSRHFTWDRCASEMTGIYRSLI